MKCPKCPREFKNKQALVAHFQVHDEKPASCPNCNRLCKSDRGLQVHLASCKPSSRNGSQQDQQQPVARQALQYCPNCGLHLAIINQALAVAHKLGV